MILSHKIRHALLCLNILVTLSACATFQKCGFEGCPGDRQITVEVQSLFNAHAALQAPNSISIQTLDRVVYLYGFVDTGMEQQLAATVALKAHGIERVVNSIAVRNVHH